MHITFPPNPAVVLQGCECSGYPSMTPEPATCPGVPGTSPARGLLTQQGGGAVTQGVLLVAGHAERRDGMESFGQEGLQARSTGVGRVEEVVDLLTSRTQLGHWGRDGGGVQGCPACTARSPRAGGHRAAQPGAQHPGRRKQDPVRGKAGEANPGHQAQSGEGDARAHTNTDTQAARAGCARGSNPSRALWGGPGGSQACRGRGEHDSGMRARAPRGGSGAGTTAGGGPHHPERA